jgi:serine/threonine protein kinase
MESDDETLFPGSWFAKYEIVRMLGEGGFGAVYEAVQLTTGRSVALKVLRAEVASNEEVLARFFREAQAIAQLHHPNIVEAVDMGNHNGRPFIVMELLIGESLTAYIGRLGRLGLSHAVDILIPMMAAMRCAHSQGITHRDLKPDNVFITQASDATLCPKVLDFGFAKMAQPGQQITRNDTTIGTPNFMSPEQMTSPREVDARSDQWALGVLLYFMLTGIKPFSGKSLIETLKNVLHSEIVSLRVHRPDVPEEVEQIIGKALQKNPDARYPSVHPMAEALMKYASDHTAMMYSVEFVGDSVWEADPDGERTSTWNVPNIATDATGLVEIPSDVLPHSLQPQIAHFTQPPPPMSAPSYNRNAVLLAVMASAVLVIAAVGFASFSLSETATPLPRQAAPIFRMDAAVDVRDAHEQ